jgi:hypothetical protein
MPLPGRGYRFDLRVRRKLTRSMVAKITIATRRESVASDNAHTGDVRRRIRLHLSSNTGIVRVASWLESTWSKTPVRTGSGLGFGTKIQIGRNTKLDLWANLFRITSYESRIYTFEPDVWGGTRLQMLTGQGIGCGFRFGWGKQIRLLIRQSILKRDQLTTSNAIQLEIRR